MFQLVESGPFSQSISWSPKMYMPFSCGHPGTRARMWATEPGGPWRGHWPSCRPTRLPNAGASCRKSLGVSRRKQYVKEAPESREGLRHRGRRPPTNVVRAASPRAAVQWPSVASEPPPPPPPPNLPLRTGRQTSRSHWMLIARWVYGPLSKVYEQLIRA